jgi:hypothetical protein
MKIMLATVMAASQAIASDKKSFLQRLMIDICSSGFLLSNGNSHGACRQTLREGRTRFFIDQIREKTPAKKRVAGAWEMSRPSKERAGRDTAV